MDDLRIETIELTPEDSLVVLPENRPFRIRNSKISNRVGILLIHGFTGSPWEMRDIGWHMAQNNSCALGIRLPGHGTSAEDLSILEYEDWLSAVEDGYRCLSQECDQVVGIGLSTGALLLVAAAEKIPFAGLVLLSPYLKLRHFFAPLAFFLRYFVKYSLRPADLDVSPYYYRERPLASIHQIYRLIRRVKRALPDIKIPTLVASAAGDITIKSESAITLYNELGSQKKEYYRFGIDVPHVLTTTDNPRQAEVLEITSTFTGAIIAQQD